jgi:putative membrane protein insertion efficiency factor
MCSDIVPLATHTPVQRVMLRAIRLYQTAREGRPSPCRFWPTCSHYGYEAIETHGAARGAWLTLRRLMRCRPFGPSGVDPVPDPRPGR